MAEIDEKILEQLVQVVQLQMEQLNAQKQALVEDKESAKERAEMQESDKLLRDIKKTQDKYGRLNLLTARSWKDFGNRVGNQFRLALTKSALKKAYPKKSDAVLNQTARRLLISGSKGFGVILTKIVPAIGMMVTILNSILKMISERGQYLKSTTMYYPGLNTGQLFNAATRHAAMLNNPLQLGFFAGNEKFKSAYRSLLESGVFFKGEGSTFRGFDESNSTIGQLLDSFKQLAEQGMILGNSFQETANIMTTVGSQYYMGRGKTAIDNYRFINSAIQYGLTQGFTGANITSLLSGYNKNLAFTSNFGFQGALREILTVVRAIGNNTEGILDNSNPQMLAAQLQSLNSMNVSFAQFIALAKGTRAFGKSDLSGLAESYRTTGQFERLSAIWNTLTSQTGLDTKTLMAVAPGYFGGLQGKSGQILADIIKGHADILSGKEFEGLTLGEQLKKLTTEFQLRGLSPQEAEEAKYYAQQQLLFEEPLKTIIALLTSVVQGVVQIASASIFGKKLPASEVIRESMDQINNMNMYKNGSNNMNTWGGRY